MWACKTLTSLLKVIISLVLKRLYLTRIDFVVLSKQDNKLEEIILWKTSWPREDHSSYFTWIFSVPTHTRVWMATHSIGHCWWCFKITWVFFLDDKSQARSSKTSVGRPKINMKWRSRRFTATMERSSRTPMWTPYLMKKGSLMSSRLRTHLNKTELLRGRTGL